MALGVTDLSLHQGYSRASSMRIFVIALEVATLFKISAKACLAHDYKEEVHVIWQALAGIARLLINSSETVACQQEEPMAPAQAMHLVKRGQQGIRAAFGVTECGHCSYIPRAVLFHASQGV